MDALSLATAVEAGQLCIWHYHADTQCFRLNHHLCQLLALPECPAQLSESQFLALVSPEDRARVADTLHNFLEQRSAERLEFQFRIRPPDGDALKLESFARRAVYADGQVALVGICRDLSTAELAKTETLYRSELESLIMSLSMNMISAPLEALDDAMTAALEKVSRYVGADRAYRFDYDWDNAVCHNTHEWCAQGISPQIEELQNISVADLALWTSSHRKGLPFLVSSVSALPRGHPLREILEPQEIKSLISLPMMQQDTCVGFIGFDAVRIPHSWTEVETSLLTLVAQLMVNAEERRRRGQELRQTLRELQQSRDAALALADIAQNASESKSRFVANMSHEIRTPLHVILGMCELLLRGTLDAQQQRNVLALRDAASSLSALIEDILDFSRFEAQKVTIAHEAFSPAQLLDSVAQAFAPLAVEKRLALRVLAGADLEQQMLGDMLRIRQILNNLIGNAIKFTEQGCVEVQARMLADPAENEGAGEGRGHPCVLELSVRDTGIGIAADEQTRVFQPFYQADNPGRLQGTGLGLTIVQSLVRLMNGTLELQSSPGQGSTFSISLPMEALGPVASIRDASHEQDTREGGSREDRERQESRENREDREDLSKDDSAAQGKNQRCGSGLSDPSASASTAAGTDGAIAALQGRAVLLVEDNRVNQMLVSAHLKDSGCELVVAGDGREALTACAGRAFDLILMDCRMPVMDGFEATRTIRAGDGPSAAAPIIALTANTMPGDREACLAAGMNDFVAKPFSREQLINAIAQYLSPRPA
jgi:signal transduction histidine kinase/ActR/RegA family two-component response regulator